MQNLITCSILRVCFLVLKDWEALAGPEEVGEWLGRVGNATSTLPKLLKAFLGVKSVNGRLVYWLDPEWLKPHLDPSTVAAHIESVLKKNDSLSELERTAASQTPSEEYKESGKE